MIDEGQRRGKYSETVVNMALKELVLEGKIKNYTPMPPRYPRIDFKIRTKENTSKSLQVKSSEEAAEAFRKANPYIEAVTVTGSMSRISAPETREKIEKIKRKIERCLEKP